MLVRTLAYLLLVSLIISGCATYSQLFVTPNGQIMRCSATGQGVVGMAVASNSVNGCKENMLAAGYLEIERAGVIGVQFSNSTNDSLLRVLKVFDKSPASQAGIRAGDYVIEISRQKVDNLKDAQGLLFGIAGTTVDLVIIRDSERIPLTIMRLPYTRVFGSPQGDK